MHVSDIDSWEPQALNDMSLVMMQHRCESVLELLPLQARRVDVAVDTIRLRAEGMHREMVDGKGLESAKSAEA